MVLGGVNAKTGGAENTYPNNMGRFGKGEEPNSNSMELLELATS